MTTRNTYLVIAVALFGLALSLALFLVNANQNQVDARWPTPVDPAAGNQAAATLIAEWHATDDESEQDAIGGELCKIGNGMYWADVGETLAKFFKEEGCY